MWRKGGWSRKYGWLPFVVMMAFAVGYFARYLPLAQRVEVQAQQRLVEQPSAGERSVFDSWQSVFRSSVKSVLPSVVQINVVGYQDQPEQWFGGWPRDFFNNGEQSKREFRALGSGVVVRRDRGNYYVLTNQHVVNNAEEIEVVTYDGKSFTGKVIGQDKRLDLGLVKIETKNEVLAVAPLGDSDVLETGDWVVSIGSPFGFQSSVTAGIVSFVGRHGGPENNISDFIQTDASINRGNSGGALVNMRGEVIGINTWISSSSAQVSAGVGFAIPINTAKKTLDQLIEKGEVEYGWLGVHLGFGDMAAVTNRELGSKNSRAILEDLLLLNRSGAFITGVYTDSPAAKAGLRPGDFVVAVDGTEVDNPRHLTYLIGIVNPGERVDLKVLRAGVEVEVSVRLGKRKVENEQTTSELLWPGTMGYPLIGDVADRLSEKAGVDIRSKNGIFLNVVEKGSPFDVAGLKAGDVVLTVNGEKVKTLSDFYRIIGPLKPRDTFTIDFDRSGAMATTSTFTIR